MSSAELLRLSPGFIDEQLERILRAAGSSLRHYTPYSKDALRREMRQVLREARAPARCEGADHD